MQSKWINTNDSVILLQEKLDQITEQSQKLQKLLRELKTHGENNETRSEYNALLIQYKNNVLAYDNNIIITKRSNL
jgi:hypothetical protein